MGNMRNVAVYLSRLVLVGCCIMLLSGCAFRLWMYDQPRADGLEETEFFADNRSARPAVPGTVAVGEVRTDEFFYTGRIDGELVDALPMPVTSELLDRGQEQYEIYCTPCHGLSGYGNGMTTRRGGTPALNFHSEYGRNMELSYYYVVMTEGFRNMYPYDQKITPEDRWAIAAYIRALQMIDEPEDSAMTEEGGAEE